MADQTALFDITPADRPGVPATPAAKLSADRRRTIRQAEMLAHGRHPLGGDKWHAYLRLHPEAAPHDDRRAPGRRCGNCWYRRVLEYNSRSYPKCLYGMENATDADPNPGLPPRVTHGAATDCRAWWPACLNHVYGDPALSDDAARHVPEPLCERCNYPGCEGGAACMERQLRALGFDPQPVIISDLDDAPDDEAVAGARRVETVMPVGGVL
jgi:hypothetical protein